MTTWPRHGERRHRPSRLGTPGPSRAVSCPSSCARLSPSLTGTERALARAPRAVRATTRTSGLTSAGGFSPCRRAGCRRYRSWSHACMSTARATCRTTCSPRWGSCWPRRACCPRNRWCRARPYPSLRRGGRAPALVVHGRPDRYASDGKRFAMIWDDVLPPTPSDVHRANLATVVTAMDASSPSSSRQRPPAPPTGQPAPATPQVWDGPSSGSSVTSGRSGCLREDRFKKLHWVSLGVFDQDLLAANADDDLVAEADSRVAKFFAVALRSVTSSENRFHRLAWGSCRRASLVRLRLLRAAHSA